MTHDELETLPPPAAAAPAQPAPAEGPLKLAAIDIGSNSIHLVMVEVHGPDGYRVLGRDKEMVRLGRGGYQAHRLTDEAMDAAAAALSRFERLALAKGIHTFRAVATSAVREAVNGGDFIERIHRDLGLKIKVISGREEGRLVFLAVRHAVDFGSDTVMVLDLGGGSLEVAVGTRERLLRCESFKLGAGRMAELFVKGDPPAPEDLAALERHVAETLAPAVVPFASTGWSRCIGTSGTISALAGLCAAAEPAKAPATGFTRDQLGELYRRLVKRTAEQRAKVPGMDARRIDQITAGAAVVLATMTALNIPAMTVSEQALRDGIVLNYLDRHRRGLWARHTFPDPRMRTVLFLAERCAWHQQHAEQVSRLALRLFDQLRPLHGLPESSRELLQYAALLHDIGYLIGQEQHNRHSEYLIRNGGLQGFSPDEIEIIALTTRFHRGADPEKKAGPLKDLDKPARKTVRKLAALLRLAEGLDRSHFSVVGDVEVRLTGEGVVLDVTAAGDPELEVWAADRRKTLAEAVLKMPITVRHVLPAGGALTPEPLAGAARALPRSDDDSADPDEN